MINIGFYTAVFRSFSSVVLTTGVFANTEEGPTKLRITGRNIRPWKSPKVTTKKNILKKLEKTWLRDPANSMKAKNVENPPLKTAGPMFCIVASILSLRVPGSERNL